MNAHADAAAARMGQPVSYEPGFVYIGHWSAKIMCPVCFRTGYPGGRWREPCLKHPEHPHRCTCGNRYPSKAAIAAHIRACERWGYADGHRRCSSAD